MFGKKYQRFCRRWCSALVDWGISSFLKGYEMKSVVSVVLSLLALTSVAQANLDIVGGSEVPDGSAVAQSTVAIYFENGVLCTSTIIAPDVLMTAAHCVVDEDGQRGLVVFDKSLDNQNANVLPIVGMTLPDDYVASTDSDSRNDIALVRFEGALPAGYAPANLPTADLAVSAGAPLTVAGYGLSDPKNQDSAGHLLQTNTQVSSETVSPTEFMTQTKGKGVCSGDSGGPAYMQSGGKTYVVGVTNLADKDCTGFSVFLKVSAYLSWIQTATTALHQ